MARVSARSGILALLLAAGIFLPADGAEIGAADASVWRVPDVGALPDDARDRRSGGAATW